MKKNYLFLIASLITVISISAAPTSGLQFTGASASYINCGQNSAYAPAQFTVEAWAYYESTSGGYLISNEGWDGTNGAQGFSVRTSGTKIELATGSNGIWPSLTSTTNIALNTWIHIAITYSGTEIKMYVNGVLDATGPVAAPMVASNQSLCIGEGSMWKDRRFTGKMSDLRLWNVVRTQAQIAASMSSSLVGTETGLVANWKMNEGTGNTITDATGNHTVTKPDAVTWFNINTAVKNTIADNVKVSVSDKTLKINNLSDSKIIISVYSISGQKVLENSMKQGNSFEENLNAPSGVYILKCVSEDGSVSTTKFKL